MKSCSLEPRLVELVKTGSKQPWPRS